jgi:squalene-hopene/tetraprenyl-beta-curcumene cyclase
MGLCAFDDPHRASIVRGIQYLLRTQNRDGSWTEHETTGTGFPKVFYLKYDMYRNSWPLLALATYRKLLAQSNGHGSDQRVEALELESDPVAPVQRRSAEVESLH